MSEYLTMPDGSKFYFMKINKDSSKKDLDKLDLDRAENVFFRAFRDKHQVQVWGRDDEPYEKTNAVTPIIYDEFLELEDISLIHMKVEKRDNYALPYRIVELSYNPYLYLILKDKFPRVAELFHKFRNKEIALDNWYDDIFLQDYRKAFKDKYTRKYFIIAYILHQFSDDNITGTVHYMEC